MKSKLTLLICILLVIIPLGVHAEVLTYAEAQEAIRQSIQAWYMRGAYRQYNSSKNTYDILRHPEDATSCDIGYSVCSGFTNDVWMEAFGFKSTNDDVAGGYTPAGSTNYCKEARTYLDEKGCTTSTLKSGCKGEFLVFYSNKDGTSYYYNPSKLSANNIKKVSNFVKVLQPGDIVSYDGHVSIVYDFKYDSEGNKIDALLFESTNGGKYAFSKIDYEEARLHQIYYYRGKKTDNNNILDINSAYMPYEGTVRWRWFSKYPAFVTDGNVVCISSRNMCSITRAYYKGSDGNAVLNYDVKWENQIKTSKARMELPGIFISKTSNRYDNNSVGLGETITYTLRIINNSNLATIKNKNKTKKYPAFTIVETLPGEVEFVSSSIDDSLQGTYDSSNNTIKWEISSLQAGGTVLLKYKVKVKNDASNIGHFIKNTGKVYKNGSSYSIPTGTVRHEIIYTTSVGNETYKKCFDEKKNAGEKSLSLIQKTYECAYKETNLEFNFNDFSKSGTDMLSKLIETPVENPKISTAVVRLNTSGSRKIYADMILNNYWNGLAERTTSGDSVFLNPRWRNKDSGNYIGDISRAKTIASHHFKAGDVLIYYIKKAKTKSSLQFTNEDGLYAFIYIDDKFVGVNYSGSKERNTFTKEYYSDNGLDLKTHLYNGSTTFYDYANLQTLFGKDAYVILRPEKVITEVSKIIVKTMPTKTSYYQKQTLNTSGGVITATYNDGTSEDISMNNSSVKISGFNSNIVGEQDVTVTYKGKSTSFKVTIIENAVSSISIKTNPSKVSYYVGDSLSLAGGVITVHYAAGSTIDISMSNSAVTVSGFNSETAGTKTITVKYANKTTTFTVQVNAVVLSTVVIDKYPSKLDYETGQDLDLTGGKIKLIYNNGTVQTLDMSDSQITVSGYDKTSVGLQEISLSIMGKIVTFDVIVNPKTTYPSPTILLKDISIYSTPFKLDYYIGEQLDLTGGKVKVYYDYIYGEEVTSKYFIEEMKSENVSGFSSDTAGTKTITVNYDGHTATFDVVVSERDRTIKKISISKLPRKRRYIQYQEDLSVDEGSITITYIDDSTEVVPLTEEDVTLLDFDNSQLGEQQVVVIYKGVETSFPVTVYESADEIEDIDDDDGNIQSVEIAQGADKTRYIAGETFDVSGIILRVLYEDGATRNVELSDYPGLYTISGFDNTKVGEQFVTIYYGGYGVQLKVEVIPGSITIPSPDTLSTKSLITIIFGLLLFGVGGTIIFINTKKEA